MRKILQTTSMGPISLREIALHFAILLVLFNPVLSQGISASGTCSTQCNDYNTILIDCEVDNDSNTDYNNCVCNDPNFKTTNAACVACYGPGSAPFQFQQACKAVPPDCTVACWSFGLIIQGCADERDQTSCVCSGAYDIQYPDTFNQAFSDCVLCENGGGVAAGWESTCCSAHYGCNGLSSTNSIGVATSPPPTSRPTTIPIVLPSTTSVPSTTTPIEPAATTTCCNAASLQSGVHVGSAIFAGLLICYWQTWMT